MNEGRTDRRNIFIRATFSATTGEREHYSMVGKASRTMERASRAVGESKQALARTTAGIRELQDRLIKIPRQSEDALEQTKEYAQYEVEVLSAARRAAAEIAAGLSENMQKTVRLGKQQLDIIEKQRKRAKRTALLREKYKRAGGTHCRIRKRQRDHVRKLREISRSTDILAKQIEQINARMQKIRRMSRGRRR